MWLPKDDLRDSSSWSSPPLMLLRDIHSKLLNQFDCKEVCASPSQVNSEASGGLSSQDGVPQQQEGAPLCIPQINLLIEDSFVRDESSEALFLKPMSWLGQIRSHRRDETWSASLCQTFFSASMGVQIPVIVEKPLATCGCKKFQLEKRHTTGWLINCCPFSHDT